MHVGFKALEAAHGLRLVHPLRVVSSIGTTRFSKLAPELDHNQYTPDTARRTALQATSGSA